MPWPTGVSPNQPCSGCNKGGTNSQNITDEEAKDIYRMITEHRAEITAYSYETAKNLADAEAYIRKQSVDSSLSVKGIEDSLEWATDHLVQEFGEGRTFNWQHIHVDDSPGVPFQRTEEGDLILGKESQNILFGHGGNDVIHGGAQDDVIDGAPVPRSVRTRDSGMPCCSKKGITRSLRVSAAVIGVLLS